MKKVLLVLVVLSGVGCSLLVPKAIPQLTRAEKFKQCIIDLSREGIKQSLIKELCEGTYGSLD